MLESKYSLPTKTEITKVEKDPKTFHVCDYNLQFYTLKTLTAIFAKTIFSGSKWSHSVY